MIPAQSTRRDLHHYGDHHFIVEDTAAGRAEGHGKATWGSSSSPILPQFFPGPFHRALISVQIVLGSTKKFTCPLSLLVTLPFPPYPPPTTSSGPRSSQAVCTHGAACFHRALQAGAGRAAGASFDYMVRDSPRPQLFLAPHTQGSLITLAQSAPPYEENRISSLCIDSCSSKGQNYN